MSTVVGYTGMPAPKRYRARIVEAGVAEVPGLADKIENAVNAYGPDWLIDRIVPLHVEGKTERVLIVMQTRRQLG